MHLGDIHPPAGLRARIAAAHRRPETECVPELIRHAGGAYGPEVIDLALRLAQAQRDKSRGNGVQGFIQAFSLSSHEGVALMCLAEALLRIPDQATRDALIRDKLAGNAWSAHREERASLLVRTASWGLMLSGRLLENHPGTSLPDLLAQLAARGGEPLIRRAASMAVSMLGRQFVAGRTIRQALGNSRGPSWRGYRHSYDMLGEAAMTESDARRYYGAYESAIHAIGGLSQGRGAREEPGISIKLSALHPRYSRAQRASVMAELLPRLVSLAELARHYGLGMNIDAEESERLDLSLDLLEALCTDGRLADWDGMGFVVQAYQKRALAVVDYLIDLSRRRNQPLMLRLVKGAYWDGEIKRAQLGGMADYPVYTRKIHTDVSYLACARRMLEAGPFIYPQFATHNALTLATVYEMAGGPGSDPRSYEFQCLHGMGEALYDQVVGAPEQGGLGRPCRIYAPVGTYDRLLAYLVRRLLENGANTSFLHQLGNSAVQLDRLLLDPVEQARALRPIGRPHEKIPLPESLLRPMEQRVNSAGLDLADDSALQALADGLAQSAATNWRALPLVAAQPSSWNASRARPVLNPADHRDVVGMVIEAGRDEVDLAVSQAVQAAGDWAAVPPAQRAACLRRAAHILEEGRAGLIGLIVREAGKSLPSALAEVREAVDFLRYYAERAEVLPPAARPLGPVACISPWNFPLAIFTGQVAAALAAGNTVLAKPAEQTSLVAAQAVAALHESGIPAAALQLLPGTGESAGAALVENPQLAGVMFTGSFDVAKSIAGTLAQRLDNAGRVIPLIAETGGVNAMIVDSSALAEQAVADILVSAFDSAGQRCSALRLLCVQEDCADNLLEMLRGAMAQLRMGLPGRLETDVGPLIDAASQAAIEAHIRAMRAAGFDVEQLDRGTECRHGTFVPPTLIMLDAVGDLEREVFGPVLHIVRYRSEELDGLIDAINAKGYGLTFGVHTRLDGLVTHIAERLRAGNVYVNRNMIGAAVGMQPFGGEGLSGTGPKAGGPLYLWRLIEGGLPALPPEYADVGDGLCETALPAAAGEANTYRLTPRGSVLCRAATESGARAQLEACLATGNRAVFVQNEASLALAAACSFEQREHLELISGDPFGPSWACQAALFEGGADELMRFNRSVAALEGPIVAVQGLSTKALAQGARYAQECLVRECSVSINTAAAGGNASLLAMD